ncbi:hypothetical protein R50345_30460 [Paenibacillus sp. FSL R5-0345]|uniref:hypothetical protein n=1 Tax=Paenibacillus sp. FSL R5-0345 TaxID=1536770 RepID=UPI0004F7708C|nr:hypothetical protein [Paenibacillus sp. FSL R5-0345]AIQ38559.1 hypothetical protein R50345_30460 [Paenibacillus sp. FSL R5-0345]
MLQQITPKASLQQVMLNFGNHKKVERAINSLLKNQNSEISFYNLNRDLVKGGEQIFVCTCFSLKLSWKQYYQLLDFYGDSFGDVFGEDHGVEPNHDCLRLFKKYASLQSFGNFDELKGHFERSSRWTNTVLRLVGIEKALFTFHFLQISEETLQLTQPNQSS